MNSRLPEDLAQAYELWLNVHPQSYSVAPDDFASIYRWGINYALRSTAFLSPQFEALRKLVKFTEMQTSRDECLQIIAKLQQQINELQQQLLSQQLA